MSDLKISPDLFLGVQEINRLKKVMREDGFQFFIKSMLENFGVIYNKFLDPSFNFLKVGSGVALNTIAVNTGYAYNQDGAVIYKANDNSSIPVLSADIWQWVKIKQAFTTVESSVVSIGGLNSALMTTTNGNFTQILRGQPDYPSKIKFTNSTISTLEYEVLEVIDDNNAIISGIFNVVETNLNFIVVGTFTPGIQPQATDEEIFQYDSCEIDLVAEITLDTPPAILTNQEFFLARIMNSSTIGMIIQDKRSLNICKTRAEQIAFNLSQTNDVIAVESVKKFVNKGSTFFVINLDWKLNILAETRNYQQNSVSISNGIGGRYKSANDFVTGVFNGWKYVYEDGSYNTILSSTKNAGNINLLMDGLNDQLIGLYIMPDCNEISVSALVRAADAITILYKKQFNFNVNTSNPTILIRDFEIFVAAGTGGQLLELKFMHKKMNVANREASLNLTTYYTEQAYTIGVLTDMTKVLTGTSPTIGITL